MAFDPNIILGVGRGVQQIDTPLEMETKRAVLANVRQKAQDEQQARADDAAFRQALQANGGDWDASIQQLRTQGRNTLPIEEALTKHRNSVMDGVKKGLETEKLSSDIMGQIIPNIHSQDDWNAWLPKVAQIDPEFVKHVGPAYDEKKFAAFANIGVDAGKQFEASQKAIEALSKGDYLKAAATMRFTSHSPEDWEGAKSLLDHYKIPPQIVSHVEQMTPEEIQQTVQGVAKPEKAASIGSFEDYIVRTYGENPTPDQIIAARKKYGQADDRAVKVSVAGGAGPAGGQSDVKETVAGMIDGTLPPVLPGRATKEYNAIMAESHRQHFDLAKAAQDWTATSKYLGTLNGAQQVRLRQATEQVAETVPLVRSLVKEWDSAGIPLLSAANLKAARSGAYGNKAQSLANRLDAQIADLTSELGTVYKGGNTSTDESLKLAARNLGADWSKKAALDALDQIEQNIKYRRNSMKLGPVTGENNRYAPDLGARESDTTRRPIPGIPGGEAELRNGRWIRVK